jgi:DNA-damage-inducible protein J
MATNAVVRARIDEKTKKQAAQVLKKMGLTVSDAFRLMMVRTATEKRLPFDLQPNAETAAAIREARSGKLKKFSTVEDLMADLNEND